MDTALADLQAKVDLLVEQVGVLSEQARAAERRQQDRAEFMADLLPVASDAFRLASEELEEVQHYVDLGDLLRLAKRLARNGRNLESMLDQLEGLMELAETTAPLVDGGFGRVVDLLDEAEQRGYFTFARGGLRIVDNIVANFTREDVEKLGDNVVLIINTVKDMTQPEVMSFVRSTVHDVEGQVDLPVETSYRALLSQLRDPSVRRGLALTLRVLSTVGSQGGDGARSKA